MESMNVSQLTAEVQALRKWQAETNANMDQFFLLVMGIICYLMQGGFAFLEAGSVRAKNTTNILIKNALDSMFAGVSYWLVGYAFAYGDGNAFIGYTLFAHYNLDPGLYATWFFQFVFAATAATIVSGAVAERCEFIAYIVYSTVITGFVYPVVTHWVWSGQGWLNQGAHYDIDGETVNIVYVDFAGSGAVHALGGMAALVGAAILGPRIGRFDKHTGKPIRIKGHSVPMASLGGFILVFGFFAFNGASLGSLSGPIDGQVVSISIKNTVLAGSGGAFTVLLLNKTKWFGDEKWGYMITLNGCLTGMVSLCSGCDQYETYMAFILGILGGVAYLLTSWTMLKLKIDDPLDATAVHLGGGILGVIAVAFFSNRVGLFYFWNKAAGYQLAWQLLGITVIVAWTGVTCGIMFVCLRLAGVLRVPFEYEIKGLDIPKHGEPAYPDEAWGHGWAEKGTRSHRPSISHHFEIVSKENSNGGYKLKKKQQQMHERIEDGVIMEDGEEGLENGEFGTVNNSYTQDSIDTSEPYISSSAPDMTVTAM